MLIASGVTIACPVKMYMRYFDLLGSVEDKHFLLFRPIFRSKNVCTLIYKNKKLSFTAARSNLFSTLKSVAGEHVNIGIHSLRSGGATVAASSKVDGRCLKRHFRWKSDLANNGLIVDSIDKRLMVSKSLNL